MNNSNRIQQLEEQILNALNYQRMENEMTYAEAIGVLWMIISRLDREANKCDED